MITYFGVGSAQVPEELRSAAVPGTGRCAAAPLNFPILQQASPGLARSEGKEHPSKLMGHQSGAQPTPGTPRDWCWWQGKGMLGK